MVCLHSLDSGNHNLSNLVNPQSSNSKKAIKVFGIISFNVHIHGITRAFRPRWVLTDISGIIVLANTFCYATRGLILSILKNFRGSKMRFISQDKSLNPGNGPWYSIWVHGSMLITSWTPVSCRDHLRHIHKYHALSMFLVPILKKIGNSVRKSSR